MSIVEFDGIVPDHLSLALRCGRCVLFAGSGLSMQARRPDGTTLPAWQELLFEVSRHALANGVVLPNDVIASIRKGALVEAGQELQELLSPDDLADIIRQIFRENTLALSPGHVAIPRMRWRAILTTNYDGLLERAYTETKGKRPTVLTFEDYLGRHRDPLRNGDFFIYKVHGDLSQPRSIVLGTRSYQDLIHWNPGYRFLFETLLNSFTVLFIGFGGSDPDVTHVLDALATRFRRRDDRHYILMPRNQWSAVEIRRNRLDRGLETIEYDDSDHHVEVSRFLKSLSSRRFQSQRPLITYRSRSVGGELLRALIETLGADWLDIDTFDEPGWFDEARGKLELAEMLVLTSEEHRIESTILASLADELNLRALTVICDTSTADPLASSSWAVLVGHALKSARPPSAPQKEGHLA